MSSSKENTRHCCLCGTSPREDPSITIHRFPKPGKKNSLRCELWAKYAFPNEDWSSPTFQAKIFSTHKMLCSKHFKTNCFIEGKLFRTVVPDIEDVAPQSTVFIPIAGSSRINQPLKETSANLMTPARTDILNIKAVNIKDEKTTKLLRKMKCNLNRIYRLQKKVKHLKNESFLNVINDSNIVGKILKNKISPSLALLLQGELQNFKRKTTGRRWNIDAKIIALRLYKRSPTCYNLLRRMMCLPAPSSLKSLLSKVKLTVGINKTIFSIVKKYTKKLLPSDSEYILMWDEMSIRKHLNYNSKTDVIEGFQDHGNQGRSPQPAAYALVFMIVGMRKQAKQPIAYYFSGGSVTADRLSALIKEVLKSCIETGLNICATVCDMDGVNRRALSILGASVEHPFIHVNNNKIVAIFDTPHLLKCFRNLFMKYNVQFTMTSEKKQQIATAKWEHIKQFYELDNTNPNFVFAPCLTKEHIEPSTRQKMRVKYAAQVLSHSVAAGIYTKIASGDMPPEAVATANLLADMDKLFDGVNASTPDLRRGKKFSTNLKVGSGHLEMFKNMKLFFRDLKFMGCRSSPPSIDGWIWTLNGLEHIWRIITCKYKTIKSLSTRKFQQDPLENLFGCIRTNCGSNNNPTVGQFIGGIKTAILSNMAHNSGGNCEQDSNSGVITNIKQLITPATDICIDFVPPKKLEREIIENIASTIDQNIPQDGEIQACAYVCGFLIKKYKIKCEKCKNIFVSETQENIHNFVEYKQYEPLQGSLKYASKDLVNVVEKCATLTNMFLEKEAYKENIKLKICTLLKEVNYDFLKNCEEHKDRNLMYIINSVFHICVKRFCVLQNRKYSKDSALSSIKRKNNIIMHK